MSTEEIKLVIKPIMETGDVKSAVSQMEGYFSKMKLTPNMRGEVDKLFRDMAKEADIFAEKSKGAFKTAGDVKSFEQSGKRIEGFFQQVSNIMTKLRGEDLTKLFNIDTSKIQTAQSELTKLEQKIKQVGGASFTNLASAINELNSVSKSKSIDNFFSAFKTGDLASAEVQLKNLISNIQSFSKATNATKTTVQDMLANLAAGKLNEVVNGFSTLQTQMGSGTSTMKTYVTALQTVVQNMSSLSSNTGFVQAAKDAELLRKEIDSMNADQLKQLVQIMLQGEGAIKKCANSFSDYNSKAQSGAQATRSLGQELDNLKNRASYFLSLENSVNLFRQGIRKAIETVKELDKAMTETAVVTDFSIGDMWDKLPQYTKMANELGVATQGVYEASTLYYQQGLKTEQVMALTNETLKMARIAGLECADATDLMTAALRGFNMEINETNAQRVNDVYSELAAITAADTNEIATAMTKTASIASSANMELETTAALLAQMIETTREPAETAGTAMKTIVARFTEMKKAVGDVVTVDGEEVNVNKVEEALKSAGVALRDVNGEFRDNDDVLLELASKWNSLDIMTQRYIATTAAGSRQQSRFIAMMQDYDRTVELVNAAYNSAGSSSQQFAKTQESLESKLARLKNAWDTFLMGIADDKIVKGFVDALTGLMNGFNKLTENLGGVGGSMARLVAVFAGFRAVKGIIEKVAHSFAVMKGEAAGATIIGSLAQKINNVKAGKGFVVNADVDTKGFKAKIATLKKDWAELQAAVARPLATSPANVVPITTSFEVVEGKLMAVSVAGEAATESIEVGLTEVEMEALTAAGCIEEVGDEFTEAGITAKVSLDKVQKELAETIALSEALEASTDSSVNFKGFTYKNTPELRSALKKKATVLQGAEAKMVSGGAASKAAASSGAAASGGAAIGGTTASLTTIAATLGIILVALTAIATIAAAIYNKSPFKHAKNEAENAASAVEDYNRALDLAKQKGEALAAILKGLEEGETAFDTLITGSAEWYQEIAKTNEELIKQIDLLNSLGYNIEYSYDENGMLQVDENQIKVAQLQNAQQQLDLTKGQSAATHTSEVVNLKKEMLETNSEEQWAAFGETFGKHMANAGIAAAGTEAAGLSASGIMAATGVGAWTGIITIAATQIAAAVELIGGAIVGVVDGISEGVNAVDEIKEGDYAQLTQEQKEKLDKQAQESAAATWSLYATDPVQNKAGLKVIENTEDAYTQFYGEEAYKKRFGGKYRVNNNGNSELELADGSDINKSDLNEDFLKSLGYSGWQEAATSLGLNWDSEVSGLDGLYQLDSDGKKTYLEVGSHGGVDKASEWSELLSDPSGKNIDAGFLALKLAQNKGGFETETMLSSAVGDKAEEILYGTAKYNQQDLQTETGDSLQIAVNKSINDSNQRKRDIESNIIANYAGADGSTIDSATAGLSNLVNETFKISVDANEQTALAFQSTVLTAYGSMEAKARDLNEVTEQYSEIFQDLDVTKPSEALEVLNQKIEDGVAGAEEMKAALTSEGATLDISHQFGELYSSGVLDELGEDIAKLSDEAGAIDVTATRELVDSNSELKNIMDEFNVSGYAMGKILTDIQNGELTLTEINNGLIESYKTLYSAMGQAEDVLYDLRNADLGEDYTEIGRTYGERYATAKDLYDRKAYGSENFAGNMKSLIGEEEWDALVKDSGGSNKTAYEKAVKKYHLDKNKGNLYGSFSSLISEGAIDSQGRQAFSNVDGKVSYDFSDFESYDDILNHMVDAFSISRDYAKAMLADMATYSDTLQTDLDALNAAAVAQKNYDSMYFQKDENGNMIGYTAQTNAELANVYGQTDQWAAAEDKVNDMDGWDELSTQEKNDKIAEQFKTEYGIQNTYDGNQIDKVDSQGNLYYKETNDEGKKITKIKDNADDDARERSSTKIKDEKGEYTGARRVKTKDEKTVDYKYDGHRWEKEKGDIGDGVGGTNADSVLQSQLNADAVQDAMSNLKPEDLSEIVTFESLSEKMQMETEDVYDGLQTIANDPVVMQMATELNSEEYDAWLAANYGENAPKIMLSAGFSQESLAAVDGAKNEMITQIQGIALALEALEVTIPIELGGGKTSITWGDKEIIDFQLPGFKTAITVGGKGTKATYVEPAKVGTHSGGGTKDFTSENNSSGTVYDGGNDEANDPNGGGGGGDKDKRNYAEENADKQLEALDRVRETNDREAELIGKLPEEIQFPLKMMNMAEDMAYEFQEIQINRNKLDVLEADQRIMNDEAVAKGLLGEMGSAAPIYYDEMLESYMWNVDVMNSLSDGQREKAHETKDSLDEMNGKIQEVKKELDGGKIQQAFLTAGKVADSFSEALKDTEKESKTLGDAFAKLGKGTILEKPLKALGDRFENLIDESKFLDKEFKGMGETLDKIPISDSLKKLVSSTLGEKAAGQLGNKGMGTALSGLFGEGGALAGMPGAETISQLMSGGPLQALFGAMTGDIGSLLGGMGSLLNFDMMGMGLDMFNGMKDMAQKMIQYVVQFITTVINWWINREDWLYNLLSAIEQEVHNFNRQEQVEERFRLYSDEGLNDLVSAWEAMRESLEKQIDLNEQLIKSRQAELQFLNLTNLPFSPAFYYDYMEERVIENPWVYDIYVLLLDLGAMIPEIGEIFSSIKQLMEDNKKRMEDAVKEIEDAREEILELEKKQLELRTKYMEDEIELEELVMDSIIEKQQEEIDELSAMNDAISEGNEKLIETLNRNLERIREQRDNEEKEEELGEKERRLAYLRQDTSNANRKEIMDLREELEDERRDYTDELIDQKISALEEQNERAAEQRQKQIDLLQAQLDHTERYGLQWEEAQTLIKNGFDSEGRLRVGSELFDMLMNTEDFTSMGNGSTRQVQQIMDWNVTSIAAAAFREINDIWEEGFGNFAMSNDVHDQSRLHLWADREVDYIELPSWLSFLQPAVNTIQDYLWRTGTNIETFIDTSFLSGKNSSSILGKTVVPLLQELVNLIKGGIAERNKTSEADGVVQITDPGYIGENAQSIGYGWIERFTNSIGDGLVTMGDNIVEAFTKNNKSNTQTVQKVTENNIDNHPNFYITVDGGDPDSLIDIIQDSAYNGNYANMVGEY